MSAADGAELGLTTLPLELLEEEVIFSEWRRLRHSSRRCLQRTAELLEALGLDPDATSHLTLGVVGSKGKGTASAYASATLAGLGYRVGTVMSPGILSNADRIRINGRTLEAATRRRALLRLERARRQLPEPTEETGYLAPTGLFLVMAMLVFAEHDVDVVVAEAGIGGRSDDLSHFRLDAVVITQIFAEHLDLLGPRVVDVARNKAAVIGPETRRVISLPQTDEVAQVIRDRVAATGSSDRLLSPDEDVLSLLAHRPEGFQRRNAAAGVSAAMALHETTGQTTGQASARTVRPSAASGRELESDAVRTIRSVTYPGRLSAHAVPGADRTCVVDSAVSQQGLATALTFASTELEQLSQVLVCLPDSKDLAGFVDQLQGFTGRKVFIELPGAYIGTPARSKWPQRPGWEWLALDDIGAGAVHISAGSPRLHQLLAEADSLAVGTVLYTSLVLRTLGVTAQRLFDSPEH